MALHSGDFTISKWNEAEQNRQKENPITMQSNGQIEM
jgi:hypothetical protein